MRGSLPSHLMVPGAAMGEGRRGEKGRRFSAGWRHLCSQGYMAQAVSNYRQNWVQVARPQAVELSDYSVGMIGNIEGLCCRSTIFSTAFILALGCKPIHLQK